MASESFGSGLAAGARALLRAQPLRSEDRMRMMADNQRKAVAAANARRVAAIATAAGAAALLPAVTARAQAPTPAAPTGAYTSDPLQSDLITGQNKTGPYPLAWSGIHITPFEPVAVDLDGKALTSDDYTVDAGKGTITFTQPVKPGSMAHVQYYYDPKTAKRNNDYVAATIGMTGLSLGGANIQMSALSGAAGSNDTHMVISAQKTLNVLNGGLTSQFLTSGGSTAAKMAYKIGNDKNGVDAQYTRAEKQFASVVGKSVGYADPLQNLSLAARLRTANWFGTSFTRSEQKNLRDDTGRNQSVLTAALGGVGKAPTLNVSQQVDTAIPAAVAGTTTAATVTTTNKANLAAKLGTAAITANTQRVLTDTPVAASNTKTESAAVGVTAPLASKIANASVALTTNSTETSASLDNRQDVTLKVQPLKVLTLSAEQTGDKVSPLANGVPTGTPTETTVQSASAVLTPIPFTTVTTAVQTTAVATAPDQPDAKTAQTRIDAVIGSGKAVEIGGTVTNRSASTVGGLTLDTTQARLALRPMGGIALTGAYTNNPEANGAVTQAVRQELGLTARRGNIDFGSSYALTTLTAPGIVPTGDDDAQYGTVSLSLGMQVSKYTKLSGGYKDGLLYGGGCEAVAGSAPRGVKQYTLGLTHTVGSAVTVSMNGTQTQDYSLIGRPLVYQAQATVGMKF